MRLLLIVPFVVALSLACTDDEPPSRLPTSAGTLMPSTPQGRPSPTDGTVAPQNPGATDPVQVKANPDPARGTAIVEDVRVGAHPENGGWDRIVFEFRDALPAGEIRYATQPVVQCGSGMPVQTRGSAVLTVRFDATQAHDDAGKLTVDQQDLDLPGPGTSVLQVKASCDFEGVTSWAIGTSARKNFKVTALANPPRVVIDVKH